MKKFKKFLTLLLTLSVFVTFTIAANVTVFAADDTHAIAKSEPSADDTATITVEGVTTTGAEVTAYRIIAPEYDSADGLGFIQYVDQSGLTGTNKLIDDNGDINITPDKISLIDTSKFTSDEDKITLSDTDGDHNFTATVGVGTYLIRVTKTGGDVYNDMVVSVNYTTKDGDTVIKDGSVSADSFFLVDNAKVYAKKSTPDIDKDIVTGTVDGKDTTAKYNDVAIGDLVEYKITGTIPSYDENKFDPDTVTYTITDKLSKGLTAPTDPTNTDEYFQVTVGGTSVSPTSGDKKTYTINQNIDSTTGETTITIAFDSSYILSLADDDSSARAVTVKYKAELNENAEKNFDANTNTVTLNYSNNSGDKTTAGPKTTNTYTFDINPDVKKVDEDSENLAGAIFKLVGNNGKTYYAKSTSDGKVEPLAATDDYYDQINSDNKVYNGFTGLDAGTYTMTEVKAPTGYSLNTTPVEVTITPEYTSNQLTKYTVTFDDDEDDDAEATRTYTYVNDTSDPTLSGAQYVVKDTPLSSLPSTGGMGTYLFTIAGVALMVVALALIIARKKRKA
ncbi:MAG: SpaH/EbpB family LPXTG-anchored major pilin [Anaerovoracaceae bacterium]